MYRKLCLLISHTLYLVCFYRKCKYVISGYLIVRYLIDGHNPENQGWDGIFFFFLGDGEAFPCRIMTRFEEPIHVLGTIYRLNWYHVYTGNIGLVQKVSFTLKCCPYIWGIYSHFFLLWIFNIICLPPRLVHTVVNGKQTLRSPWPR